MDHLTRPESAGDLSSQGAVNWEYSGTLEILWEELAEVEVEVDVSEAVSEQTSWVSDHHHTTSPILRFVEFRDEQSSRHFHPYGQLP